MKKYFLLIIIALFVFACNKDGGSPASSPVGTWVIRSVFSGAFPYPNNYPQMSWNYAIQNSVYVSGYSGNSSSLKFDQAGNFTLSAAFGQGITFSGSTTPVPSVKPDPITGTYTIAQDSFLIVHTDTTFLKSTYNYRANAPFPNGDKVQFRKISNDSLVLVQQWKTNNIYQPQDTGKLLFVSFSSFKRI